MEPEDQTDKGGAFHFSVRDVVDGREIGPAFLPFALLQAFTDEVGRFLRGGTRLVDLAAVPAGLAGPALGLTVTLDAGAHGALRRECGLLADGPAGLARIDPRRAEVILGWQEAARKCPQRVYRVYDPAGTKGGGLRIDAKTRFQPTEEETWVEVEKYLFGRVVEAGGKTNTNLHLVLDGSRETVIVTATEQQLQEDERNRLFHEVLVHVSARENLRTHQLRDVTLLAFADQSGEVDEDALARMVARGTQLWRDLPEAAALADGR